VPCCIAFLEWSSCLGTPPWMNPYALQNLSTCSPCCLFRLRMQLDSTYFVFNERKNSTKRNKQVEQVVSNKDSLLYVLHLKKAPSFKRPILGCWQEGECRRPPTTKEMIPSNDTKDTNLTNKLGSRHGPERYAVKCDIKLEQICIQILKHRKQISQSNKAERMQPCALDQICFHHRS